ncbi:hypothetical protein MAH4_05750 [Sessilibacter sp. MAH4]
MIFKVKIEVFNTLYFNVARLPKNRSVADSHNLFMFKNSYSHSSNKPTRALTYLKLTNTNIY